MRVLHVSSSLAPVSGGVATALARMAESQAAIGLTVSVVSTWVDFPGEQVAEQLRKAGVSVRLIQAFDPRSQHPQLRSMMDQMVADADIVHIHALWESIQHHSARACQAIGRPYVLTPHGMLDPWNLTNSRWKKKLYLALRMRKNLNRAARLHFTTQIEKNWVARLKLKPPTIVEPLGIDVSEFASLPDKGFLRARFPSLESRRILIYLGRIHTGKGLELLIPAFAKIKTDRDALVIAGPDSDFSDRARELVKSNDLQDHVFFTGLLQGCDRLAALVDADLFALPSYHENFGLAAAEAMACGLPVIVSDQVNLHPEITAAAAGAVVRLDVNHLANELKRWLCDEPLRLTAGQRARGFALEHYDSSRIAHHWADHYEAVLK